MSTTLPPFKCKRCHKFYSEDFFCIACKSDLLSYYEVSRDWQTAYTIERAELYAQRLSQKVNNDE